MICVGGVQPNAPYAVVAISSSEFNHISTPPRIITFTDKQLQRKVKHAPDIGIVGNYNKTNAQVFDDALLSHVADPQVQQIVGMYRREPVIHYVDLITFVDVMTLPDGTFHSVWKLNPKQAQNVIKRGSL